MKWIGQHIYDLISRFRNDVYLEDVSTGTIASGGNLGLDSNNKIVKATETTGDITSVRITTDSGGSGAEYGAMSGDVDLQIFGTNGVGVTNSGATITATAVPGEIDHDSLLNFAAGEHFTQANITTVGTIGTGVWQGTAIASAYLDADTAHLSGTQTFTGAKTFDEDIVGETTVQKWIKNVAYVATQGTTETFIPMVGAAENTSVGNGAMAMIMPTAGKLLKVHLKTQRDHSGVTTTIKMYNWDADEAHGGTTQTLLGSVAQTGPADDAVGVFDFQSVSTNAFTAGEMLAFSITNDGAVSSSCKYFVTLVFELDWASY